MLRDKGIEEASRKLFNSKSKRYNVPQYDAYLLAFEEFSGLKKGEYKVNILDFEFHFYTEKGVYEVDTYEGRIALYKNLIENRAYFDLVTLSDNNKWNEIYESIPKSEFVPVMQEEIEYCLNRNLANTGMHIERYWNFEEKKKKLLGQFQVFIGGYDKGNVINLARKIDEDVLYPVAVITMASIYNICSCCEKYCELEFQNKEEPWEVIFLNEKKEDPEDQSPGFYIRLYR